MRILHIINSLDVGGAEKLLLDTIPLYNAKGAKTDLLIFKSSNSVFLRQLKATDCCNIIELQQKSVYNPLIIFKLIKHLKYYDIAHVHLFPAQYFVPIAKKLSFSKIALIFTEHNTFNNRINHKIYTHIDKIIYRFYKKTIAISTEIKTILLQHITKFKDRIVVIENGIDISKIENAESIKIKDITINDKLILQVSAFRLQKDQKTVIKALAYLPKNVKLLLAGEGETMKENQFLAENLKLRKRVFFLGNRDDIPNLLKTAHIIVLSSKYEGLSLSSIEAMASGNPFIASNVPGIIDIVKGAGILFEQGNSKELAEEIIKLLEDKTYYNSIVKFCQERAKQFDISKMVNNHIDLYNEISNQAH